jgi:CHAT domain-containing protein/Tfp pilus assembly protein PilF
MDEPKELKLLNRRVAELYQQGKYSEATPLAFRSLELARLERSAANLITPLNNLAQLHKALGKHEEAEQFFHEALKVAEGLSGDVSPSVVVLLHDLAKMYTDQGRYPEAEALLIRALQVADQAPPSDTMETGKINHDLGKLYHQQGKLCKDEEYHQRALSIYEKAHADAEAATVLLHLGLHRKDEGNYGEAEALLKRALEIREKVFEPEHPAVAQVLNGLGAVHYLQCRFGEAESVFLRAHAIRKKAFGGADPKVATVLDNLGLVYHAQNRYGEAERAHQAARDIYKQTDPAGADLAKALHNLGWLYDDWGKDAEAENLYLQSLHIQEVRLPCADTGLAATLHNLAWLYFTQGKIAEAESRYLKVLAIRVSALGPDHIEVARVTNNLALLYCDQGRLQEAESYCKRTIAIVEQKLGSDHPYLAPALTILGVVYLRTERPADALRAFERSMLLSEPVLANVFAFASELEKLKFLPSVLPDYYFFLNIVYQEFRGDPGAVRAAFDAVLKQKGIVLDALVQERRAFASSGDPEAQRIGKELQHISSELSNLWLKGRGRLGIPEYNHRIRELEAVKETWEKRYSSQSGAYGPLWSARKAGVGQVGDALPPGSVLIEYVSVPTLKLRTISQEQHIGADRYLAFVLASSGGATHEVGQRLALVDLGQASAIDQAIWEFQREIACFGERFRLHRCGEMAQEEQRLAEHGRRVYELVFAPVENEIGANQTLFVSPDGEINLIPLGAIQDNAGHYLIERYQLNYLSSGRDLLGFGERGKNGAETIVIADPDYDNGFFGTLLERLGRTCKPKADDSYSQTAALALHRWGRLPGTREEAKGIQQLFPGPSTKLYTGKRATKGAVQGVGSPQRLHIATHGFFLDDLSAPKLTAPPPNAVETTSERGNVTILNPLARSGLVLAGANRRPKTSSGATDEGILTALEASSLQLLGTDLVVLSACETGVGQTRRGEGVFGLRRAFELAGARTVVISLWNISDRATSELMVNFYGRIKDGQCKGTALRSAQLHFVNNRALRHPYFWSAFVSVGEP